jgi:hypothetical protein
MYVYADTETGATESGKVSPQREREREKEREREYSTAFGVGKVSPQAKLAEQQQRAV